MAISRTVGAVTACLCLFGASGVLLQRALAEPVSSSRPTAVSTTTALLLPPDAMVARAADRAALVRLCLDGLQDPAVGAYYRAAAAAHPTLAAGIGPDCSLAPTAP
jgi:hypothetical protein